MDLERIGSFLASLRRERGLTQEALGEKLGVTNKTVSRWEKGNYLPPAEMLKALSEFYGVSINEILSGERLAPERYQEKAEENITAVIRERFTGLDRLRAAGAWLRKNWWVVVLYLLPSVILSLLLPHIHRLYRDTLFVLILWTLFLGANMVGNHLVFYVSRTGFLRTGQEREYSAMRRIRTVWLMVLVGMSMICLDTLLALLHVLTPAGTADGYHIISIFQDRFIPQAGIYPDRCFETLQFWAWRTFGVGIVNADLAILWMKK